MGQTVETMRLAIGAPREMGNDPELRPSPKYRTQLLLGCWLRQVRGYLEELGQLPEIAGGRQDTPDQGFPALQHMCCRHGAVDDDHPVVVHNPSDGFADGIDAPPPA